MEAEPPGTYWAEPGRLLAGPYPRNLDALRRAGVTLLLDLTHPGEQPPYEGVRSVRMPVDDFGHPTAPAMVEMLDAIDAELKAGGIVYAHCRGGLGRTGTVVACWLVRQGASPEDALAELTSLRAATPTAGSPSPETPEQVRFVHEFTSENLDMPANRRNTVKR